MALSKSGKTLDSMIESKEIGQAQEQEIQAFKFANESEEYFESQQNMFDQKQLQNKQLLMS